MRSHLTIDSPEPPGETKCLVQKSTPIISTYVINGEESTVDVPETTAPA